MLINEKVKSQFFEMLNNSTIHDITMDTDYTSNAVDLNISATMTPNIYNDPNYGILLNDSMSHNITIYNDSATISPNYGIKKVIFNDPATIVYWTDGTKTVVKCCENDAFNKETGLAMAFMKKKLGNDNTFHKVFKKWIPKEEEEEHSDLDALRKSLIAFLKGFSIR